MRKWLFLLLMLVFLLSASAVAAQEQTYIVQPRDNITGIAQIFDVDADAILIRNNIIDPNRIRVGQELIIPASNMVFSQQHIVNPGENLNDIALRYNTSVDELVQLNQIGNANAIVPGQVIVLPVAGATGGAALGQGGAVVGISGDILGSGAGILYRVDTGETLRQIAAAFNTTVEALVIANNIPNPNYIQAGTLLVIPPQGGPVTPPPPPAPAPVPLPTPITTTYVVQAGNTLSMIAATFNTTVEAIRVYNGLSPADPIFIGQVLIIPGTGGPVAQPPLTGYVTVNGFYTVRAGDTMFRIANAFNRNIYDIAQANGILNLNSIFVGQALRIPGY